MAIAHSPRARVSTRHPVAFAICDRCGFQYNHPDLDWQFDWRGSELANLRILVCRTCLDVPQPNGRKPIIIGPDPVPVQDPRPGFYATEMQGQGIGPQYYPAPASFIMDDDDNFMVDNSGLRMVIE